MLKNLQCWNTQLKELDVSRNPALTTIDCTHNPSLSRIYIANGMTPGENWQKDDTAQWIKK